MWRMRKYIHNIIPNSLLMISGTVREDLYYFYKHIVPIEWWIKRRFKQRVGYLPNLNSPKTFNEKLQWLKLYDHNALYTRMVDKYEAKKYVADIIGEKYIIPTLGVWDDFDEIDFNQLPEQFVLKCTHDSGSVVVCQDKSKFDKKAAKKKLGRGLRYNYYYSNGFEWPYKNVKPRIIAEQYLENTANKGLVDYKFYVFNGEVKFLYVSEGLGGDHSSAYMNFFDKNWQLTPYQRDDFMEFPQKPKCPNNFTEMISLSEKIANVIKAKFARIDLYEIDNNIYFSECTFFPGGGMTPFSPYSWEEKIGDMLNLGK